VFTEVYTLRKGKTMTGPKILLLDIETAPIEAYVWGLWDNNVALNQIKTDWSIISWAAKFLNHKQVLQEDVRNQKDKRDDSVILKGIHKLLDEADIIVTQNGKSFDAKKLNARFILNGMRPPSSYQHIDTKLLAKKYFGFTSNSLEYMTDKLCVKYKKLKHKEFPGQELWTECLKGNSKAWKEMAKYNIHDVLALEELYKKLIPWDNKVNFNVYYGDQDAVCTCGSTDFRKNGYCYTKTGKYQRFECKSCGSELRSRQSLVEPEKRKSMLTGTNR
jgi:hypothetical protein